MSRQTVGQTVIKYVCDRHLAPLLKPLGYRKKGSTFFHPGDICSRQISVQGSWTDSAAGGSLQIFMGLVWHPAEKLPPRSPRAVPRPYFRCTAYQGLHNIHAWKRSWWQITPDTDLDVVGQEVRLACERLVFRWLDASERFAEVVAAVPISRADQVFLIARLSDCTITPARLSQHGCPATTIRRLMSIAHDHKLPLRGARAKVSS